MTAKQFVPMKWVVLRDRSGWHRAWHRARPGWDDWDGWDRASEQEVGEADSYLEACKIADQYNQISEVQDG